jgi:hypothetical protein
MDCKFTVQLLLPVLFFLFRESLLFISVIYVLQKPGSRVLVVYSHSRDDAHFGITISHISDIVGPVSLLYFYIYITYFPSFFWIIYALYNYYYSSISCIPQQGMVYVVEESDCNCNSLLDMADKRFNIVPIVYGRSPYQYRMLINIVDVLFAALDRPGEVTFPLSVKF